MYELGAEMGQHMQIQEQFDRSSSQNKHRPTFGLQPGQEQETSAGKSVRSPCHSQLA